MSNSTTFKIIYSVNILWLFLFFTNSASGQEIDRLNHNDKVEIKTSNICSDIGYLIINKGDSANGELPTIGFIESNNLNYFTVDTIKTGRHVKEIVMGPEGLYPDIEIPVYLLDDTSVIGYKFSYNFNQNPVFIIYPFDTIYHNKIISAYARNGFFNLVTDNSFIIYDPELNNQISISPLDFTPHLIFNNWNNNKLSIIGFDSINFRLKLFDVTAPANPVLEVDTVIPPLATDPFKANVNTYNNGEFVSHPGDSLITLNKFNPPSQQFVTKILYNNSPLNVCDWGFNSFFFQPESDPLGTQDSLKVFEVFFTGTIEYLINKRLIFLKPASGSFANSVIIIDSLFPHIIEFYQSNFTSSTSVTAGAFPYLIEGDFRCPVSIEEYDDELVNIITFPNPTTGVLNISMSGLLCGKDYDLEVIDEIGRSVWKQTIQSKKTFTIPFDEFKKGLYSITLHTSKGRKSVKVLKI